MGCSLQQVPSRHICGQMGGKDGALWDIPSRPRLSTWFSASGSWCGRVGQGRRLQALEYAQPWALAALGAVWGLHWRVLARPVTRFGLEERRAQARVCWDAGWFGLWLLGTPYS